MSYHIVNIDSPECSISCRNGQLTCRTQEGEKTLPLEDVASIVVTSFSASIHSHLLIEAAKKGISLILCDHYKPVSLVLPANRSTDTLLTRAHVSLPASIRQELWRRTVDAKCQNQYRLAECLAPESPWLQEMWRTVAGKHKNKESMCAREFWRMFGKAVGFPSFERHRDAPGINGMLNYGYAVLLSLCQQKLFAVGIDPTFGLSHTTRERSTPLAYDIMEPFRPCVDHLVIQWVQHVNDKEFLPIDKGFKQHILSLPLQKIEYRQHPMTLMRCVEAVVTTLRSAILGKRAAVYQPWIQQNSKWDG